MEILTKENLEKLNTERLLSLYKSVSLRLRWYGGEDYPQIEEYMNCIKEMLNTREHVK